MTVRILTGDARSQLATLPTAAEECERYGHEWRTRGTSTPARTVAAVRWCPLCGAVADSWVSRR